MGSFVRRSKVWSYLVVVVMVITLLALPGINIYAQNTVYYVDAVNGNDNNSGTSENQAWSTLSKVNSMTFEAGDSILFKKGDIFSGMLWPKGSGIAGNPIRVGSYGTGDRPVISARSSDAAAVQLFNQEYWEIEGLEIVGGHQWGIRVSGDQENTILDYFRVRDCVVRAVHSPTGNYIYRNSGGIIFYLFDTVGSQFNDILIENCTVYDVTQYNGIGVWGREGELSRSTNITIQNCVAYDIGGTGIHIACGENATIKNNLTYRAAKEAGVGVELWRTTNALVEGNESYDIHPIHSGSTNDNGAFDLDYFNKDVLLQYNYGHDSAGYGIILLGASDSTAVTEDEKIADGITIRYNIFSNNCRWTSSGWQGEVILSSFGGGSIDGVKIHNNTIYSNPSVNAPAFHVYSAANLTSNENKRMFFNNIIYSENTNMINARSFQLSNNIYYHTGGNPRWIYNGTTYTDLSSYQSATGKDFGSLYANPEMNQPTYSENGMPTVAFTLSDNSPAINGGTSINDMGTQDFYGNQIPLQGSHDIGAFESNFTTPVVPVNLALNKSVTTDSAESGNPASNGNDGNESTRWCAENGNTGHWWKVDLGKVHKLTGTKVHFEADNVNYQYRVEVSDDDASWTTVADNTSTSETSQIRRDDFTASARYVRITYTSTSSMWASHYEFEVFGEVVERTNIALSKSASADTEEANNPAGSGNDGTTLSRWCATDGNSGHWWKVDLGSIETMTGSRVHFEQDNVNYQYRIDVSDDNVNWTTAADKSSTADTSQIRVDDFTASGRYVRITYTNAPGWWASHYEFEVYSD